MTANLLLPGTAPHARSAILFQGCIRLEREGSKLMKLVTLQQMREIAASRGGKCLSIDYINTQTKLKWQCTESHIWEAMPNNVKRKRWCRLCGIEKRAAKKRLGIERMIALAAKKGGKCLSDKYNNNTTKLKWRCGEGHIWSTVPKVIKRGGWCPHCYRQTKNYPQTIRCLFV